MVSSNATPGVRESYWSSQRINNTPKTPPQRANKPSQAGSASSSDDEPTGDGHVDAITAPTDLQQSQERAAESRYQFRDRTPVKYNHTNSYQSKRLGNPTSNRIHINLRLADNNHEQSQDPTFEAGHVEPNGQMARGAGPHHLPRQPDDPCPARLPRVDAARAPIPDAHVQR